MSDATIAAERGASLLRIARSGVAHAASASEQRPDASWPTELGASFVTLRIGGELRGCIGTVEAHRMLGEDVYANAIAAATRDPRFPPVTADEVPRIDIEVSVLSALEPIAFRDRDEALAQVVPGEHGVLVRYGGRRGTLLPQVWDSIPSRDAFFRALNRKMGLAEDFWDSQLEFFRYTVTHWTGRARPT